MQEKKFAKSFRLAKIIQLSVTLLIDIFVILILICNPGIGSQLYSNKVILTLSAMIWVLILFSLLCILYDFRKLRSFAEESHALNKAAYLDNLTGIPNRSGLDKAFQTYNSPETMKEVGCFIGTISNIRQINETQGHSAGDRMILDFCNFFEEIGDRFGFVGRNGGNEYVMVTDHCMQADMQRFIDEITGRIAEYNTQHTDAPIDLQYAYLLNKDVNAQSFAQLLTATYNKLHS